MSTRGWEGVTRSDLGVRSLPKPSKYKNVKFTVDSITFDSKREANYWLLLKARVALGEIRDLERQRAFPLHCPTIADSGLVVSAEVCRYVCDFSWLERGILHVADAKGMRTQLYRLKAKWFELEYGFAITEV